MDKETKSLVGSSRFELLDKGLDILKTVQNNNISV